MRLKTEEYKSVFKEEKLNFARCHPSEFRSWKWQCLHSIPHALMKAGNKHCIHSNVFSRAQNFFTDLYRVGFRTTDTGLTCKHKSQLGRGSLTSIHVRRERHWGGTNIGILPLKTMSAMNLEFKEIMTQLAAFMIWRKRKNINFQWNEKGSW